jgi:HK97 family phage major capsid protein
MLDGITGTNGERGRLAARGKTILETAEQQGRELTQEEKRRFDEIMRQIDTIDGGGSGYTPLAKQIQAAGNGGETAGGWRDVRTGRVVQVIPRERRLADVVRSRLPEGIKGDDLDVGRWFRGVVTGNWHGAEGELRAMAGSGGATGGFLLPEPLAVRVIDLARNAAVVMAAGAQTVLMDSATLALAKVTKDPTAAWKGENAAATASDMNFGRVNLSAKTLVALLKMSVELVEDSANLSQIVSTSLGQALALELDRAALRGAGGIEPLGVRNWSGIQTIDKSGGLLSVYDDFSTAWQKVLEKNGPSAGLSVIYAPVTAGNVDRRKDGQGLPLQPPASWRSMKTFVSNQVPANLGGGSNESEAYVGAFNELLIGLRTEMKIEVSREAADSAGSAFGNLQVWIRAYLRVDVALEHDDHFVVLHGFTL